MIIAVDFDGTLCINGKPNINLIRSLMQRQRMGDEIILWTCREGKPLIEAVSFLRKYGFMPKFVNCNTRTAIKKIGHDSRKVYADVYLDDKNCRL